jgi:hypothetical protein
MSLSTPSSTGSPYAAVNSGGSGAGGSGVLKAIEAVPARIVDGVADVGEAVGDAASATVSFSERAMQALASGGMAVVHGVESAIAFPFEVAVDAVEGGVHLLSGGVHAAIDGVAAVAHGAEAALHAVAIDLPTAIASDVADVTHAALGNATTLATAATGVALLTGTSPVKMIGAMF